MQRDTQTLLGLGLLFLGLAIATESNSAEGDTLAGVVIIGGCACLEEEPETIKI